MSRAAAALAAGVAMLVLVAVAPARSPGATGSPLVPRDGGARRRGTAPLFLVLLVAAFAAYLVGLCARSGATAPPTRGS